MSAAEETARVEAYRASLQARYDWRKENLQTTLAGDDDAYETLVENWGPLAAYYDQLRNDGMPDVWPR